MKNKGGKKEMKKCKRLICFVLAALMILSINVPAFALETQENGNSAKDEGNPLAIEVTTNKSEYSTLGIAKIDVTVTNTSSQDIQNVSAEAVFKQLAPAGRNSETKKEVDTLKAGESISFSYKATINKEEYKLNIFEKIFLWLVRLFNGGFTAKDNGFDDGRDYIAKTDVLSFGKFSADNEIKVWYGETGIDNNVEIGYFKADPYVLEAGEYTDVTFSVDILSETPIDENEIKLYKEENGEFIGTLSKNETLGDNIYSLTVNDMFSAERCIERYYIRYKNKKSNHETIWYEKSLTEIEQKTLDVFKKDVAEIKAKYTISREEYNNEDEVALERAEQCYNEIVTYLDNRDDIEQYEFHPSLATFTLYFDFSIFATVTLNDIVEEDNIIENSPRTLNRKAIKNIDENTSSYKSGIITLQPYFSDGDFDYSKLTDEAARTITNRYSNYTFSSNFDDKEVTVETMKTLAQYGVIILEGHGGNFGENYGYVISLTEKVSEEKNQKYREDIDENRIYPNGDHYVVTEKFFDYYYSAGDFDNTLIYLGTCFGGDDNVQIRKILRNKGTEAVMTYKNTVIIRYMHDMLPTIFDRISKGDTVYEAVKKAKIKHGGHDPYISSDVYNKLGFWNKLWYNLGCIESSNPAELILTGNNTSFKLEDNPTSEQITGRVIDSISDKPISNVKITCEELNVNCVTDKNGGFRFDVKLPLKQSTFSFEHKEYKNVKITVADNSFSMLGTVKLNPKTVTASGNCGANNGDNLKWILYDDGELVISGKGEMFNNAYPDNYSWHNYRKKVKTITIEDGASSIGYGAFIDFSSLTSINIGNGVTSIIRPFSECTSLINVTVDKNNKNYYSSPDGVLFNKDKTELISYPSGKQETSYIIPNGVISIGIYALSNCTSLTNVKIPETVTSIGYGAFSRSTLLTYVTIPESVTVIDELAFSSCSSLSSITIKNKKCSIYDRTNTISETATIYGYSNSTTQAYAEKYNRKFVALD